jgi:hypothetical protein
MIAIRRHPAGFRLYIVGRRIHHGPAAATMALLTWRCHVPRAIVAAFAVWAATDWRDFPFRDGNNH